MLPSTGYFKTIVCPFYENGACDRPYCHFKHLRREDVTNSAATASSSTDPRSSSNERNQRGGTTTIPVTSTTSTSVTAHNPEMIQQLVSDAVNKVLADQSVTDKEKVSENIVSKVVEGLKPTLTPTIGRHIGVPQLISKPPCVYNPTPIAELKKRHIAVPVYNPTRECGVAVKRKIDDTAKPWISSLPESIRTRPTEITYKPTAINSFDKDAVHNYVPTAKSDSQSLNSYESSNSNDYSSSKQRKEAYYPKAKKRREEYVPKMIKPPLQSVQQLDEKMLEDLQPEINILDDILISSGEKISNQSTDQLNNDVAPDFSSDIEAKFSDDDEDEVMNEETKSTKEVQKMKNDSDGNNSTKHFEEKENKTRDIKSYDSNNSNSNNDKADKASSGDEVKQINSESRKSSEKYKSSRDKSERSKREHGSNKSSNSSSISRSSSKNRDKEKREYSRDRKDHHDKHSSSSSNDKRRSSTSSKHSDKSNSHRNKDKDNSSHSNHKKKSSRSSRDENSSSNENNNKSHHKINSTGNSSNSHSRHDKHSSSKSKSDNKLSSTSKITKNDSHSSSSHKESKCQTKNISGKSESEHEDYFNGAFESNFFDDDLLQTSDSDHDVEEECLKIFQEYQEADHPKGITIKHEPTKLDTEEIGKKRVAHPSAASSVVRTLGPSNPPKRLQNPQQRMYERWRLMREAAAEKAAEKATSVQKKSHPTTDKDSSINPTPVVIQELKTQENIKSTNDSQINGNGRIRIAPVPYARSLEMTKKKVMKTAAAAATKPQQELKTIAQTTKGCRRVAHIPQVVPELARPEPLHVTTQKFPINVRQYYVNLMHDICIQIYTNGEDAAQRALREEHTCHERCKALPVYKNSCMLAAHRLRKEVDQGDGSGGSNIVTPSGSGMVSHDAILAGKTKGSWGVVKTKKAITNFKGPALYCMLKKWILSEQQLKDNGFPRIHPDGSKGRAKVYVVNTRNQSILSKVPNERYCSRCGQAYMVDKYGVAVQQQSCIHHWGRKFTIRGEGKYSCCQQYGSASGCCESKYHVWDYVDTENLRGYVQTLPKDIPAAEQGVYALDCEMCYTTQGLELTRVTVINDDCKVVYETLVKPENEIIDYNTRFSGITQDNMIGVTTSIFDVQATLLTMFSNETIIVGHSLESDFKALKLIHNTVVDTSHMFPHKNGYPQKRALKNLCSEYLRKIIQNDVGGHDSNEDAVACMELIHWKVKEEAKLQ